MRLLYIYILIIRIIILYIYIHTHRHRDSAVELLRHAEFSAELGQECYFCRLVLSHVTKARVAELEFSLAVSREAVQGQKPAHY